MRRVFQFLFGFAGRISGRAYLWSGLLLFAVKYTCDLLLAHFGMGFWWWPTDYFLPRPGRPEPGVTVSVQEFMVLLLVAIPFIWTGLQLTCKRLRTVGWSTWFVCFFFVPWVNFVLFAGLILAPDREPRPADTEPANTAPALAKRSLFIFGGALLSAAIAAFAAAIAAFAAAALESYGCGLFVGVPFLTGFVPGLLYTPGRIPKFRECAALMIQTQLILGLCLLLVRVEGLLCIAMAAPLSLLLGFIGAAIGLASRRIAFIGARRPEVASAGFLLIPILLLAEARAHPRPSLFRVQSSIMVAAPASRVWESVVTFSELPAPTEPLFLAGIAYPIRAEIQGRGPGAIRKCVFSTGAFIEPIQVWDEPRLLQFSVASNPPPMKELSFFKIDPPHLHGFLESELGQFELKPLPGDRTELIGTTWYHHGLWPESYWRLWSDYIIHTIHLRVLLHIKQQSEDSAKGSG